MKTIEFTYTKSDGKTSKRVILEMVQPSKFVQGIDLSELSAEEQALFSVKASEFYEEFRAKMVKLEQEFDLANRYRQFDPAKMADVKADWV